MNCVLIAHLPTEIEIDTMGVHLLVLACLEQHGVSAHIDQAFNPYLTIALKD